MLIQGVPKNLCFDPLSSTGRQGQLYTCTVSCRRSQGEGTRCRNKVQGLGTGTRYRDKVQGQGAGTREEGDAAGLEKTNFFWNTLRFEVVT